MATDWHVLIADLETDDLRSLAALVQARLDAITDAATLGVVDGVQILERHQCGTTYYQLERKRCGKPSCRCMRGGPGHGPYWYAYARRVPQVVQPRALRKRYLGKQRPAALGEVPASAGAAALELAASVATPPALSPAVASSEPTASATAPSWNVRHAERDPRRRRIRVRS